MAARSVGPPLRVEPVAADRQLAPSVFARRRRSTGGGAGSLLGVGGDGILEVEDDGIGRERLGLLQCPLVGGGHVQRRSAGAQFAHDVNP